MTSDTTSTTDETPTEGDQNPAVGVGPVDTKAVSAALAALYRGWWERDPVRRALIESDIARIRAERAKKGATWKQENGDG